MSDFLSEHHIVSLFVPVADAFSGGISTDIICLRDYKRATCIIHTGAYEDTGVSNVITAYACTDASATDAAVMPFRWRRCRSSTTVDTWTTSTAAAAATGYNFAVNNTSSNGIWLVEIDAADIAATVANAEWFYLAIAETANKTITAGGLAILSQPRYPGDVPATAIA